MADFTGSGNQSQSDLAGESAAETARNARRGLALFAIYLAFYLGFIGLVVAGNGAARQTLAGVSIAVWYGLGLILAAFLLAAAYLWLCRRPAG